MGIIREFAERIRSRQFGAMGQYNLVKPDLGDGESCILQLDEHGNLLVAPGAGIVWVVGGPGLQDAAIDNDAWAPVEISLESNAFTYGAAFATNVPVSANGDVVRPKGSRYGVGYSMLVSQDGAYTAQFLGGSTYAANSPGYGIPPMAVRSDTLTVIHANGQWTPLLTNASGALYVTLGTSAGGAPFAHQEDAAFVDQDWGVLSLAVRRDVPASGAGSDGDYCTLNVDSDGFAYERSKSYDAASNADRNLPVTDLSARRSDPVPVIAAAQTMTNVLANLGSEIDTRGATRITLWFDLTVQQANNIQIRCLPKHTAGGNTYVFPTYSPQVSGGVGTWLIQWEPELFELNIDTSGRYTLTWDLSNTVPFVQFQAREAIDGGTDATIDAAYYTLGWGS